MNCIPLKAMASSTVTVPAVPWKTAKLLPHAALPVPSELVQLVAVLVQLPKPPWIVPSGAMVVPSQNWIGLTADEP